MKLRKMKLPEIIKNFFLSSIDTHSLKKHNLLTLFYTLGERNSLVNQYRYEKVSLDKLKEHMNLQDVISFSKILSDLSEIELHVKSYSITDIGIASLISKKYLKKYNKSIIEYVKNILQIAIFASTIYFLFYNNLELKKELDTLNKEIETLRKESRNDGIISRDSNNNCQGNSQHKQIYSKSDTTNNY